MVEPECDARMGHEILEEKAKFPFPEKESACYTLNENPLDVTKNFLILEKKKKTGCNTWWLNKNITTFRSLY